MKNVRREAPHAEVTLRAHFPAPARVELVYRSLPRRLLLMALSLTVFWGAIPFLLWLPPHYPWVLGAFFGGLFLAYRSWTGRYRVISFAGICPRCGLPLSLGSDRTISLPHTLTCFHCHFEPQLEIRAPDDPDDAAAESLSHRSPECVGHWSLRWLADEAFMVCERCRAHRPATPGARRAAAAENDRADLLERLTREGRPLI
jgi:hypothetical protein